MGALARHHLQSLLAVRPLERLYSGRANDGGADVLVHQVLPGLPAIECPAASRLFLEHFGRRAALSDPGTLPAREVAAREDGPFYYVTDVPSGTTLGELLRAAGSLPVPVAAAVTIAIGNRLEHAHAAGLFHWALHRDAVLLTPDGQTTVLDLGLVPFLDACAPDRLRQARSMWDILFPDPGAVAPELLAGEPLGRATDVYGLGALLYLLVTAVSPYPGRAMMAMNAILGSRRLPDPRREMPNLSPEIAELAMACIARRPEERPGSIGEVLAALQRHAATLPDALRSYGSVLSTTPYSTRYTPRLRLVAGGAEAADASPPEEPAPVVVALFRQPAAQPGRSPEAALLTQMTTEQRTLYLAAGNRRAGASELSATRLQRRLEIRRGAIVGALVALVLLVTGLPAWLDRQSQPAPAAGTARGATVTTPPPLGARREADDGDRADRRSIVLYR